MANFSLLTQPVASSVKATTAVPGDRIYLVGSEEAPESNASGRVVGSVTLNLGLPLPADNGIFPLGQYDGLITLNLVIME